MTDNENGVTMNDWLEDIKNIKRVVLYDDDADGFCAAWVDWRAMGSKTYHTRDNGDIVTLCTIYRKIHRDEPPDLDILRDRNVFMYDFCMSAKDMEAIDDVARSFRCLDHHQTAKNECGHLPYCTFDMDRSGAGMAYRHWFGAWNGLTGLWQVAYVEDRDLWKWELPDSRDVCAGLEIVENDFHRWKKLDGPDGMERTRANGVPVRRYQEFVVEAATDPENVALVKIGKHEVPCVNATTLTSFIAGSLAKDAPFGASFSVLPDGKAVYSLRSRDDGADVGAIAKEMGGGGHRAAAGFRTDRPLPMRPMIEKGKT